mgnify:CR=1 FL=1
MLTGHREGRERRWRLTAKNTERRCRCSSETRARGPRLLIDWLATLAVIMIFGLVMLFSASYTTGYLRMGDSFHYIKQQALCMILGLGCMFLISYVDHRFLRKMVVPGYFIVLAMLAVTLTMAPLNGCRRWIRFAGLTLQSSEVAKFEMILFSSHLAAKAPQVERLDPERRILLTPREWLRVRVWKQLVVPVLPLIPVVILLAMEPHMSGIVLTVAVVGTILLLSGSGGVLTWAGAITAGTLLETLLSHVDSIPYLQKRLDGWTQDLSQMTDQTVQSLYAIGSGGLKGLGLGNSVEKQLWLPESTNDFIFSVVCEELGFIGAVLIIVLFVLFIVQGLLIAYKAEKSVLHHGRHRHYGADRVAGVLQHRRGHQYPAQHRHQPALLLLRRYQPDPAAGRDGRNGEHRPQRRAGSAAAGADACPAGGRPRRAGSRACPQDH